MDVFKDLLREHFDLTAKRIELLEGYEDKTYLVTADSGKYVLKDQRHTKSLLSHLQLEQDLTGYLNKEAHYAFPCALIARDGKPFVQRDGRIMRLLTFLEGDFLAEVEIEQVTLESLGDMLGRLNLQSGRLEPGLLSAEVSPWDLQHLELSRKALNHVADPHDRALLEYFFQLYDTAVLPDRYTLPKSIIHNDANDWNVLTREGKVSGIIDFGDMCYSWRINELAVGLTYVLMRKDDLLGTATTVIKAYCRHIDLTSLELRLLYYLIAGRMCMSLCNSALAARSKPDSEYIRISERPIRSLLRRWIALSPEKAANAFLEAAGLQTPPFPNAEDFLRQRKDWFPPSLSLSYSRPIAMQRAAFQYMFDTEGNRFLDAYNNIMLVGHCHPHVVEATTRVLRRLNTNTRYLYEELLNYSERLLSYFPPNLCRVFLVNSGSAATDLALRLSRAFTQKSRILALEHGYHGNTVAAIEVSHYKHQAGASYPNTLLCPMPKVFGSNQKDDGTAGRYFSRYAEQLIKAHSGDVSAFIAEPIMGCGGQVPLPLGFLPEVYQAVRVQGGVCISDEVQVGFGRLGHWMWGFEKYEVVPDMVILGKPMGNGHPIGAVVTTEAIASSFDTGPEFFSSFGGNPVSCAAGLAVLEVLEKESLQASAAETGAYLKAGLGELAAEFPIIADVRGEGLFIGVELIAQGGGPATAAAVLLKNELRNARILIGTDGPANNVLKIKPPLPFNRENCDELLREMARILSEQRKS